MCALSNFKITHLGINTPRPPLHLLVLPPPFFLYFLSFLLPPTKRWPVETSILFSCTYLAVVSSFIGFDLGLCITLQFYFLPLPTLLWSYPSLTLPFIGVGLSLEFTPLFSRQRLDKCKQHLLCLLGFNPFLSSFMLLTCSMSSDISSCQVSSSRSISTVPPTPPFSTFAMLLVCSVSSDTCSSLRCPVT